MVRSRLDPPAPYVTDTNAGRSCSSRRIASHRADSSASSRGGMNSTEKWGPGAAKRSRTVTMTCSLSVRHTETVQPFAAVESVLTAELRDRRSEVVSIDARLARDMDKLVGF